MLKPERCVKCGAVPEVRKICGKCGENVWVLYHTEHYMGGAREVVPCRCSAAGSRENEKLRQQKVQRRITRDTGKVFYLERNRHVTTPEMAKKAAQNLAMGMKPTPALREAGYPEATVRHAKAGINKMIWAEFKKIGRKYIKLGKDLTPEEQELLVRGKLVENILLGTDAGVQSAKQLGADKRVAMWRPDSQVGLVVLKAPPIPKIDHEVPILPPKHSDDEEVEDDSR